MSKNFLQLEEYTFNYDLNSNNQEFEISEKDIISFNNLNEKIKSENKANTDIIKFIKYKDLYKISTSHFVGILKIREKVIQIIPKMGDKAIKNLLYMLSYTKKLTIKETDVASFNNIKNNDFFEILIYLFANKLENLISRNNFYKEYIQVEENLSYIKGKINFVENIKINHTLKHRLFVKYDDFSENNLLNQIFKYVIVSFIRISSNSDNKKVLKRLDSYFSDINFKIITKNDLDRLILNRLNKDYEFILNICRIFIENSSIEMNFGKINIYSFVFNMNELFEEFIGEFLIKNFENKTVNISLQKSEGVYLSNKKIKDNIEVDKNIFMMKPDIKIIENKKVTKIIDTKYKILKKIDKKEGVSQSDMYQMFAYSKKFNCSNIILLYPKLKDELKNNTDFIVDDFTTISIRTIDLCIDLYKEDYKLKEELKAILCLQNKTS